MKTINLVTISQYKDIIYEVDNVDMVILLENFINISKNKRYYDKDSDSEMVIEKDWLIMDLGTLYVVKTFNNITSNTTFGPIMSFFVPDKLLHEYKQSKQTFLIQI